MLHLHEPRRYEMPLESFMEEIPVNHSIVRKSLPILVPPDTRWSLQLMSYILGLQTICQPKQAELLLHHVQPLLSLKRFFSLSERWGPGIHEILETAVLIRCWPILCIPTTLVCHLIDGFSEQPLIFHHHLHQLSWIWWWRRGWIHIRTIFRTSSATRHL